MGRSDDPKHQYNRSIKQLEAAVDAGDVDETTADQILEVLDALDPSVSTKKFIKDGKPHTVSNNTLATYCSKLRRFTAEIGRPLAELEVEEIAETIDAMEDGSAGIGPDDGYSTGSLGQFQSALVAFYRYHGGLDERDIPMVSHDRTPVDARDLWDVEEVEAMRAAIDSKRDEAIFELLAYTGQRIRVIQTMRVKDVDPDAGDTGRYWVNTQADGLKDRSGHGPLLGAKAAVRRWLSVHPTGKPDDALFTVTEPHRWGSGEDEVTNPGQELGYETYRRILKEIADRAGVDKSVNPHMFRHYFTTAAKRDFGFDDAEIKNLRGDAPGSNVMETTYQHLTDEDVSSSAEAAFKGEQETENALTPAAPCPTCAEMLNAGDKACPNCGHRRVPVDRSDAEVMLEKMEELARMMGIDPDEAYSSG